MGRNGEAMGTDPVSQTPFYGKPAPTFPLLSPRTPGPGFAGPKTSLFRLSLLCHPGPEGFRGLLFSLRGGRDGSVGSAMNAGRQVEGAKFPDPMVGDNL